MKIGLAGGIGSGKSYVAAQLLLHGIKVYDCDSAAKRLMRTSTQLREQLTALIGADCYESDGDDGANGINRVNGTMSRLNKDAVSRFLLASPTNQQAINAIVHPAVFADFEESGLEWLESGIMFESGANRHVDRVIVVTAPKEVRLQRIMQRDGISREQAQQWIACQWPQSKVRRLADYEIVNDGQQDIDKQLNIILEQLCNKLF